MLAPCIPGLGRFEPASSRFAIVRIKVVFAANAHPRFGALSSGG